MNNVKEDNIIVEIKQLINNLENFKNDIDIYSELMKQIFLSNSGHN